MLKILQFPIIFKIMSKLHVMAYTTFYTQDTLTSSSFSFFFLFFVFSPRLITPFPSFYPTSWLCWNICRFWNVLMLFLVLGLYKFFLSIWLTPTYISVFISCHFSLGSLLWCALFMSYSHHFCVNCPHPNSHRPVSTCTFGGFCYIKGNSELGNLDLL